MRKIQQTMAVCFGFMICVLGLFSAQLWATAAGMLIIWSATHRDRDVR